MTARDVMSTPPQTCQPHTDLAAVTHLMWNHVRAVGRKGAPASSAVVAALAGICTPRAVESAVA